MSCAVKSLYPLIVPDFSEDSGHIVDLMAQIALLRLGREDLEQKLRTAEGKVAGVNGTNAKLQKLMEETR